MYFSPLHICLVILLMLRQRRGADLVELQLARCRSKYYATAPAHTQRALHGAEFREVGVVKPLNFPVQDTRASATGISCFVDPDPYEAHKDSLKNEIWYLGSAKTRKNGPVTPI
jgi:hypothetical protein